MQGRRINGTKRFFKGSLLQRKDLGCDGGEERGQGGLEGAEGKLKGLKKFERPGDTSTGSKICRRDPPKSEDLPRFQKQTSKGRGGQRQGVRMGLKGRERLVGISVDNTVDQAVT